MPANLTPEFIAARKRYTKAKTDEERLKCLEEMLSVIPKHKGTDKMRADIKRRISKVRTQIIRDSKGGKKSFAYDIKREGAGQTSLLGPANVGKSTLLNGLTSARADVGNFPFTTRLPLAAMMPYENIMIQIIDLPPISHDLKKSWIFAIIRNSDLLMIMSDMVSSDPPGQIEDTIDLLQTHHIHLNNGEELLADERISYKRAIIVLNKSDVDEKQEDIKLIRELYESRFPILGISAMRKTNLDMLKNCIFENLKILRVYSKTRGKKPSLNKPFVLKKGSTVLDFARIVHHDFYDRLKYARIWGSNKYEGQRVNKNYRLSDGDIIELHI